MIHPLAATNTPPTGAVKVSRKARYVNSPAGRDELNIAPDTPDLNPKGPGEPPTQMIRPHTPDEKRPIPLWELSQTHAALIARHFLSRGAPLSQNGYAKTVHLLQELMGHSTNYRFTMYATGPESPAVEKDLQLATRAQAVEMRYSSMHGVYLVTPGPKAPKLLALHHESIANYARDLVTVIETTTPLTTKELALRAIIAHLWNTIKPSHQKDVDRIRATTLALKVYREPDNIDRTILQMRESQLLKLSTEI